MVEGTLHETGSLGLKKLAASASQVSGGCLSGPSHHAVWKPSCPWRGPRGEEPTASTHLTAVRVGHPEVALSPGELSQLTVSGAVTSCPGSPAHVADA